MSQDLVLAEGCKPETELKPGQGGQERAVPGGDGRGRKPGGTGMGGKRRSARAVAS